MKEKICLVVHRYGNEVIGGAELECRLYAEKLSHIYDIDIVTTCAIDDSTWDNYYDCGVNTDNNISIFRFMTDYNRVFDRFNSIDNIICGACSYEEEIQLLQEIGPYSKGMFDYLILNSHKYKAVLFFTYMYYQTSVCMLGVKNAIMIPTAHDEKFLYINHYKKVFSHPKAFIFQTNEEKNLVEKVFGKINVPFEICGVGVDDLSTIDDNEVMKKFSINYDYCVYTGRITEGKGCDIMIKNFIQYKEKYNSKLKLVLIGALAMEIIPFRDVIYLGFLSDNEKNVIIKNSKFAIVPSKFESLSIALLEAMNFGKPVLVNGESSVLNEHIKRSKAGFSYCNSNEFFEAINRLENDDVVYRCMTSYATDYVKNNYAWDIITNKISRIIELVDSNRYDVVYVDNLNKESKLSPIFNNNFCSIVYATDNNYVPYLCVSIQSLIENAGDHNYDVIILSDNISIKNINIIKSMNKNHKNISIRFIEISNKLNGVSFSFTNKNLTRATFIRLLLPDLLNMYDKVAYIDCDTIILDDIYNFFDTDMSHMLLGAVEDAHIRAVRSYREEVKSHLFNDLIIDDNDKYFNAGVLLINLKMLKNMYTSKELLEIATSRKWMWEDQDVLNLISKNKIIWMDESWNVLWVENKPIQDLMELNIHYLIASKSPKILHFAGGRLPTKDFNDKNAYLFWNYARKCPFYEYLISLVVKNITLHDFNINYAPHFIKRNKLIVKTNKITSMKSAKLKLFIYTKLSKITCGRIRKIFMNKRKKYENIIGSI